ncbi:MAG: FHA domain-containing protein [Anaerolineae bacterium]
MAYGRLEVYYPDGAFKTFLLTDPNVSIGRSAGNMIALDVEGISRYHVSLAYADGATTITDLDSANGTFVDGERLKSNTPSPLMGGEEIQLGELRMVFQSFDESPTRPVAVTQDDSTRRLEVEPGKFTVDLFEPEQAVSPGAHISAQLTISNTGDNSERFLVEVGGLPNDWVRVDRRELEIAPGKAGDVVINFKPRRRPDSTPGDYAVTAIVRALSSPGAEQRAHFVLRVLPYGGFGMAVEQRYLKTGDVFRLHIHNQGSGSLPLTIAPRDLSSTSGGGVNVTLSQPRLTLTAGQRALITGQIQAKTPHLFGDPRRFSFDLVVRSGDAAAFTAATRLYATEKPPLPGWARYVLIGAVLTVLALIVAGLFILLSPGAEAHLNNAIVSADSVVQGQPLTVTWNADADQVQLYVNGALAGTYNGGEQSVPVDTSGLSGSVVIEVRALKGSSIDSSSHTVTVSPSFQISEFRVEPPTVTRYSLQTLTLFWNVAGAVTASITGLEGFSTSPIDTGNAPSGSISVPGIWQSPLPLTINLMAQSGTGEIIQSTLTVETVPVMCTAQFGDVALYGGPDGRGQVLATIPNSSNVEVSGRDLGGAWLRVVLSGGAQGWGRAESLACGDSSVIGNLLIVPDVATAFPDTGTPTLEPTAVLPPTGASPPRFATPRPNSVIPTPTATIMLVG